MSEEDVPKITVEGGPSHYHDENPPPADGETPKPKKAAAKAKDTGPDAE